MTTYGTMDNAGLGAEEHLKLLSAEHDPGTIRNLETLGVAPGWHCLEVGPGDGSITAWLCERVGSTGRVMAVDIDTSRVSRLQYPNLDVRALNILSDEVPQQPFDVVFARFVLEHLPDPRKAVARMVQALRPGGWLLVEDQDAVSGVPDPAVGAAAAAVFDRGWAAIGQVGLDRGSNFFVGRQLFGLLRAQGLIDCGAEGRVNMRPGGSPGSVRAGLAFERLRTPLVESELLTDQQVTDVISFLRDPAMLWMGQITMAAWGRRPIG
jgi:SAM-dependent methyltransferase